MRASTAILAAALTMASAPAAADIYKYVDKHGRTHLTDRPPHAGYKRLVKTWKGWTAAKSRVDYEALEANRRRFTPLIAEAARHYRLPAALLHAVIRVESAYDPRAVSRAGAVGLMQLMPATARRFGVRDRENPVANVHGGTHYLRELLGLFDDNVVLALAAYNAGEQAVVEHGNRIPPYRETRLYVRKVLAEYKSNRAGTATRPQGRR